MTKETKEYYNILNQRAKNGQHIAKLELKMVKEKIYKDIDAHRVIIEGVFETSEYLKPLDIVYSFDTKKRDQLIDKYRALPNIIYIATRQVNKMTTSFNREEIKQILDDSGIVYKDRTYQTFDQALESFRQHFIYPERKNP